MIDSGDPMEPTLDSNPSNYEIKSELSGCCFGIGVVYFAKHVPSQQCVAVKKFQMDKAKEESNLIRVSNSGHFSPFISAESLRMRCNTNMPGEKWILIQLIS